MATSLPPPPTNDQTGSYAWLEWFRQLRNYITQVGSVPWSIINFSGSNISDIASRSHQSLQGLQGGTTGQYYHLTQNEYNNVLGNSAVNTVAIDTTMTTVYNTYVVTVTGKTMTLPAASVSNVGRSWTVNQNVTGTVTVVSTGADTIMTPTSATETTVILNQRGMSLTFKCNSSSTWIIV